MESKFNTDFWESRYINQQTGWDLGTVSPPLKSYFDQLENKELRILIPGAGNAYEAEYLHQKGFKNVFVVDLVKKTLDDFQDRNPDFPSEHLICVDFFELNQSFDLIIEQTFFCAISPSLRQAYAQKMNDLLVSKGKLVGLLFNRSFEGGPPFGGSKTEYLEYFNPYFFQIEMEECYNSIPPRQGTELFIKLVKE